MQCHKWLWIAVNDPKRIPELSVNEKHKLNEGTMIGQLATKVFPKGINIEVEDFINKGEFL